MFDLQVASTYHGLKNEITKINPSSNQYVVDVGCGAEPYRGLFPADCKYQGIDTVEAKENFDYSRENVIYYDGVTFPIENGVVDIVLHSEVMEHIYETGHFLSECNRVLKTGGIMVLTVPFQARYHYIPFDFWRFTPASLEKLLFRAGFKNIIISSRGTDITVAGYKLLGVGYRLFFSRSIWRMLTAVVFAPLWITSILIGQISLHLKLGSTDDCLGYVVRCEKA